MYEVTDSSQIKNTKTNIKNLVLINPDNPSGNYIPKTDVLKLVKWCSERNIRIIVDESFVDFAEEEDATLIDEEIINRYPNLIILKSISKSYGIPGIRLGILVSADEKMISDMKKDVAIWNINSFGEFYMQIEEKYKKDYALALNKIKDVRRQFVRELSKISWIRLPHATALFTVTIRLASFTSSTRICDI